MQAPHPVHRRRRHAADRIVLGPDWGTRNGSAHRTPCPTQLRAGRYHLHREIETAISGTVPLAQWRPDDKDIEAGCSAPFDNLGGRGGGLDTSAIDGGIPDEFWSAVMTAARDVAARYGLTDLTVIVDQPGRHEANFYNLEDGTSASLGTGVNATLLVTTGCNLPEAALDSPPTS